MGQPAARVGDMHVCPMFDGPKPHVGGPVLPPDKPTVLIGGMPAATITDRCVCASVPDIIMQGAQTVLINGMMAARLGDMTVHGGRIVIGCPTVLIGGPTFTDTSLLRFRPIQEKVPTWKHKLETVFWGVIALITIAAAVVTLFGIIVPTLAVAAVVATIAGAIVGAAQLITGKNVFTGEKLTTLETVGSALAVVAPAIGPGVKAAQTILGSGRAATASVESIEAANAGRAAVEGAEGINTGLTTSKATGVVETSQSIDELNNLLNSGKPAKASELTRFAEKQAWKPQQSKGGPLKYIDENGIVRMTIKKGSSRAPGSNDPHVELRDASGQRINSSGEPITRRSIENHTTIDYDL